MLSFLYVYSDHSILECYNLFSGVELSMRSFFVISSGLSLEKTPLPLSMNLLSNQKLDENTVKHHLHDLYPAILLAIGHMSNY